MASGVRAKFYVIEVGRTIGGGKVVLQAVSRGQDNKEWAAATPNGRVEMSIKNDLALDFFDVGDEYYLDFSKAEKGVEG
jgi:hypothetical protein